MPPGYTQMAGGYYMIESGSCGSDVISTKSECDAAATEFNLRDKAATDSRPDYDSDYDSYSNGFGGYGNWPSAYGNWPPGCSYWRGELYVLGSGHYGSCSSDNNCICKSISP